MLGLYAARLLYCGRFLLYICIVLPKIFPLQAILPLRGKILNVERRDDAAMYKNEEIQNLILGLGLGVKVLNVGLSASLVVCLCVLTSCLSSLG